MALLTLFANPTKAVMAIVPDEQILTKLSQDIRLLRGGKHIMSFEAKSPTTAHKLYAAGAFLVLPSLRNGCLDLTQLKKVASD